MDTGKIHQLLDEVEHELGSNYNGVGGNRWALAKMMKLTAELRWELKDYYHRSGNTISGTRPPPSGVPQSP